MYRNGNTTLEGLGYVEFDRTTEMMTFDILPRELRDAMNKMPVKFTAKEAYAYLCKGYTVPQLISGMINSVYREMPSWRPMREERLY